MRYRLAAGDSFDVSFELSPEFNQTVTIQPDGFVTLKAVGDVKVVGQTVPELTQTLRTAYGKMLNDPLIVVVLKDFEKPYFIADGQVGHPGRYDMRGTLTLTQAVAMAGGFTDNAKHSQVLLFRRVNDQWLEAKIFNVKSMEKRGSARGSYTSSRRHADRAQEHTFQNQALYSQLRPGRLHADTLELRKK